MASKLITDSILPNVLQINRFAVLERLLLRLNTLPKHTVIMLTDVTDASSLPFFADHFSLNGDGWQFASNEKDQRELIKNAIEIHRYKGTPWAVKRVLKLLGYGDCKLEERVGADTVDGEIADGHWTYYRLIMQREISKQEVKRIKDILLDVAPLRSKLISINVLDIRHDATVNHDGKYTYEGGL